jgi:transcriptional regulator with XRE-family HTH domain
MTQLGERIKARRQELGWTQDDLAIKSGLSKGFLSDLENGKRNVSANNLLDIARVLSVSLDFLMKGEASNVSETEIQIPNTLLTLAKEENFTVLKTLTLLGMRRQIIAHRSTTKTDDLESVDWRKFYEAVKDFL